MRIREGEAAWVPCRNRTIMPKNSSAARREQARALAAAEGIPYTEALRRVDHRAAAAVGSSDDRPAVVRKSKKDIRARQAATGEAYNAARRALDHERILGAVLGRTGVPCRDYSRWVSLVRSSPEASQSLSGRGADR
ncbi:hypothetical protein ABZ907_47025 [Nonomuraea wenchangensis]